MADLADPPLDDNLDESDMRRNSFRRTVFRPCIDLHGGFVKQLVGGTLSDNPSELKTNFVATDSAASFAHLYRMNHLAGGHVIKLGPGNDQAAREALAAWRGMCICSLHVYVILTLVGLMLYTGGLQIGGGITEANALEWLEAGASKVQTSSFSITLIHPSPYFLGYCYILPLSQRPVLSPAPSVPLPPCRPRPTSHRRKVCIPTPSSPRFPRLPHQASRSLYHALILLLLVPPLPLLHPKNAHKRRSTPSSVN